MIKFFRKIRQNLLMENKTGKYFKYAIGEIVLVVIGILIALQINNWNEERKSIQNGREILMDIRENVEYNTVLFQKDIKITKDVINSIDVVLKNLTETKVYNDSLNKHFRKVAYWETSRWKSSGYEALISYGVKIIQSKELQESIIDLYEISYMEISEYTRLAESNFTTILPTFLELLDRQIDDSIPYFELKSKPFDYNEIIESRKFKSILRFTRSQRMADIQTRINAIEKNQYVIELIDKELKSE
jgi:hypothetical protein